MNGRKAKALRKKVYGDGSLRVRRVYGRLNNGQIVNDPSSPRAIYQAAKRAER
jgi:hypothetical protein